MKVRNILEGQVPVIYANSNHRRNIWSHTVPGHRLFRKKWNLVLDRSFPLAKTLILVPGPLARVGPNHLLTDDPQFVMRILGVRSKYARGSWFDILKLDPLLPNLVSGRNKKEHDHLRLQMSAGVS